MVPIQCDMIERLHILVSEHSQFIFFLCNSWFCDTGQITSLL